MPVSLLLVAEPPCPSHIPGCSLVHHKNQWNWALAITGEFPAAFSKDVLEPYVTGMRPHLAKSNRVQSFFVNSSGLPFSCAGLTVYYASMWVP